jgi:hypothetical protein
MIDVSPIATEGVYTIIIDKIKPFSITISRHLFSEVISANLRFLRVMRSGDTNCLDHTAGHFKDSACVMYYRNGNQNTDPWGPGEQKKRINLLGGWYEGMPYLKITTSIAYTTYYLLRAYEMNPALFTKKYSRTDLVDILDEARVGLEYLCKVMPDEKNFIIQVGDFDDDAGYSTLPDMDDRNGKRPAYSCLSAPQMANGAAALALGSKVFAGIGKNRESVRYLTMAKKLFIGASAPATLSTWLEGEYDFYADETPNDNLELAATELFLASGENRYGEAAGRYALQAQSAGWISWDSQHVQAHLRLVSLYPQVNKYITADLDDFYATANEAGNIWNLPMEYEMQGLYGAMEAAGAASVYQKHTGDKKYELMIFSVVDYVFGRNNWDKCFVALPSVRNPAVNFKSSVYCLQKRLFPLGGIPFGPCDVKNHEDGEKWCCIDLSAEPTSRFNTGKVVFYDRSEDQACMDSAIYGIADGIFLFTCMETMVAGNGRK